MGFECEKRKSTPDFLTGVCNPLERKIRPGYEPQAPTTSFAFEDAWKNSEAFQKSEKELEEYKLDLKENVSYVNSNSYFLRVQLKSLSGLLRLVK